MCSLGYHHNISIETPSTWVHDGQLYIAGPIEKVSVQSPKQGEYDCYHNLLLLFSSDFHKI